MLVGRCGLVAVDRSLLAGCCGLLALGRSLRIGRCEMLACVNCCVDWLLRVARCGYIAVLVSCCGLVALVWSP